MRKAFIILIIVILLIGVSGCGSVPTEQEEELQVSARNAYSIAYGIIVYSVLNPSVPLDNDITLEKAEEELTGAGLWPPGLSDDEMRAAWDLILYRDGVPDLIPAAKQALKLGNGHDSDEVIIADAIIIAEGINVYKAFYDNMHLDNATLAEVKEALSDGIWPSFLTDDEAGNSDWPSFMTETEVSEAWELIEIKDGVATIKREG